MKKPSLSRKVVRAQKQQHLAPLQFLAAHKPLLPRYKFAGVRDGVVRTAREKDPWEDGAKPESVVEMAQRLAGVQAVQQATVMAYGALIPAAYDELQEEYRIAMEESVAGFEREDDEPFLSHLAVLGPTLLAEPRIVPYLHNQWCWCRESGKAGDHARNLFKRIGSVLKNSLGRPDMPIEEREAIEADCLKWFPICKFINKEIKKELKRNSSYETSESHRKEFYGDLAERLGISLADVKKIESYLYPDENYSRKGPKLTPLSAMCRMVAHNHPGRGEKTIEKVWGEYRKTHPEEK